MKRLILILIIFTASLYGQQWQITYEEPSYVGSFCVAGNGYIFAGGAPGEFYRYSDQDTSWARINSIDLQNKSLLTNRAGELIALPKSGYSDYVKISSDEGSTWINYETESGQISGSDWYSYGDTIFGSYGYISSNGGRTWIRPDNIWGKAFPFKGGFIYAKVDSAGQILYDYYLYDIQNESLTPLSNYAHKRPAFYNTDDVNQNIDDSVRIPFNTNYGNGIKLFYTHDNDGNLILYANTNSIFRYINGKWEIINYAPEGGIGIQLTKDYAVGSSRIYKINYDSTFSLIAVSDSIKTDIGAGYGTALYADNYIYILTTNNIFSRFNLSDSSFADIKTGIAGQAIENMQYAGGYYYAQHTVGDIYKSADGSRWSKMKYSTGVISRPFGRSIFLDSMIISCADGYIGSYYSLDNGKTWTRFTVKRSNNTLFSPTLQDAYKDKANLIMAAKDNKEISVSRDNGQTWKVLFAPENSVQKVYTANNEFLASTYDPYVYIASDSAHIDTTTPPAYVNSFARAGSAYFGGTEQGIIKLERTQSSGNRLFKTAAEWIFAGLEGKKILTLTSDSLGVVYAGTEDGTYFSADSGATWEVYGTVVSGNLKKTSSTGLSQVKALLVNGSELFAAAQEGLYKTKTYGAIGINEEPNIAITGFKLAQNYPNPFNPETNISFTLPKAGHVKLTVYSVLGQEVGQLVNMELGQGSYNYKFDGHQLSSGVYIYSLEAGAVRLARKMLLIK